MKNDKRPSQALIDMLNAAWENILDKNMKETEFEPKHNKNMQDFVDEDPFIESANEFMSELSQRELNCDLNFLETGPLIKRRGLTETISLFKDGNERYNKDALFRKTIDSLCLGEKPEKIIDNLIDIINNQQDYMENLIRKDK